MKTIQLTEKQYDLLITALNVAQQRGMRQLMYNPKRHGVQPDENNYQQMLDALETGELEVD